MALTTNLLFCMVFVLIPTLLHAGASECALSTLCPEVTETQGFTNAYCTEVKADIACLEQASGHPNCVELSDQSAIVQRALASATNYHNYECGVAGLAASSVVCIIVCVVSFFAKG